MRSRSVLVAQCAWSNDHYQSGEAESHYSRSQVSYSGSHADRSPDCCRAANRAVCLVGQHCGTASLSTRSAWQVRAKASRKNNMSKLEGLPRGNAVVPIAMKVVFLDADRGQFGVGHFDSGFVAASVEFGLNA